MLVKALGQKRNPAPGGRPEDQFQQFGYNSGVGAGSTMGEPDAECLRIVKFEKTQWETAFAYVTEKVAFNMRSVIRQCRKNYWGVFDQEIDPTTGRAKIWEHLTKTFVDYVVAAYDLDTKDINFRAKHPDAIALTSVVRSIVKNGLDEIDFGEQLDLALRQLAIDGTIVWETAEGNDSLGSAFSGDSKIKIKLVDLLNFYIDPTVDSIAQAESVIERIVVTATEFKILAKDNGYKNSNIQGKRNVARYDTINNPGYVTNSDLTYVEIYRRRGWAPEYLITGRPQDVDLVPTEIICSGTTGNWLFHKISRRADNRKKGYQEAQLNRVHGRWYGEGIAERLIQKQNHNNIVTNIKVNRLYVSLLGINLIRKGSGITPQMLSRLAANGAISVTNIETDFKQLQQTLNLNEFTTEENSIYQSAQRYTGATDVINGEPLPASTPATNATIQNNAAKSRFQLAQEGIGFFVNRWVKSEFMPLAFGQLKEGDLVRMHLDPEQLTSFVEERVNESLADYIDEHKKNKLLVDPTKLETERQRLTEEMQKRGMHFVSLLKVPDITKFDVQAYTTNEEFDKSVMLTNLNTMAQTMAAIPNMPPENVLEIMRESMDIMGLDGTRFKFKLPPPQPQGAPQGAQGGGANAQSQSNGATGITPGAPPPGAQSQRQQMIQGVAPSKTLEPTARR